MQYWRKISAKIKTAPKTPGVYIFYGPGSENADVRKKRARNKNSSAFLLPGKKPLYVGKAANLKNRLQSYVKGADSKSERLREHATHLKLLPLRSEIEALIEEAKLIKKLNPPYNILWRDDKSYFYALITKEQFPRIFVVHKNKASRVMGQESRVGAIGPFTEGRALKLVLRMLRRNFPYCTCPRPHLRLCLNAQIGNCFGFCCDAREVHPPSLLAESSELWKGYSSSYSRSKLRDIHQGRIKSYQKNIRIIKNFLLGEPLKRFTKNLKPEEREALEKILAHREFLDNFDLEKTYYLPPTSYKLIEGYDISHLAGREVVAGMTAWGFDGTTLLPRKDFWRKFIIRTAKPADDPAAIAETVSRRLNHPEWPYPDVMIIDGGLPQFNAAREVVRKSGVRKKIRVLSFAKPGQLVYGLDPAPFRTKRCGVEKNPKILDEAPAEFKKIIPRIVQETHNFAIRFHRTRRQKEFLPT